MAALRGWDVTATVASAMIGAGIFLAPGLMLRQGASWPVILLLYGLGAVVVALGALMIADLAREVPGNGGPYLYLRERLGPVPATLYNWSRFWVMQCGALAVLALTCVRFTAEALGVSDSYWEAVAAITLLGAVSLLNAQGLRTGALVQRVLTLLKVGAILAVSFGVVNALEASYTGPADLTGGLGSWILLSIFAYGGWTQVTFLAGEADGKRLTVPILAGVAVAAGVYLAALLGMMLSGPTEGGVIAAEAARNIYGPAGGAAVAGVIAFAVLGTLQTQSMTGPRLYQAAARDGRWWWPFAEDNARGAPGKAIMFQAEWAALLVALSLLAQDAFVVLIGSISTAIWLFHILLGIAWFRGPGRVPRIVPALFTAAAAAILVLASIQDIRLLRAGDWESLTAVWALVVVASGLPLALWMGRRDRTAAR